MLLKALVLWTVGTTVAFAAEAGASLRLTLDTDSEEIVFPKGEGRCDQQHIPDSPARAFKNSDGNVVLFASHYTNVPLVGKRLDDVKPRCGSALKAGMDADPARYDAKTWLQTFYTEDGKHVFAIGSADYHGTWFGTCNSPGNGNPKCWWSALVGMNSNDGGMSFKSLPPPAHILAQAPLAYSSSTAAPTGFFTSSNIVRQGSKYFTLVYTFGFSGQKKGNCLLRSERLAADGAWSFWSGTDFIAAPKAVSKQPPTEGVCKTVEGLNEPIRSLVWHVGTKQYIAVFSEPRRVKQSGKGSGVRVAFKYATSRDLYRWSAAREFASFESPEKCTKGRASVAYPSILDPDSQDRNFGDVDNKAYLYFTRYRLGPQCQETMSRDLVRLPLAINSEL